MTTRNFPSLSQRRQLVSVFFVAVACTPNASAFNSPLARCNILNIHEAKSNRCHLQLNVAQVADEVDTTVAEKASDTQLNSTVVGNDLSSEKDNMNEMSLMDKVREKIGTVEDERIIYPELESGEIPRMYSSIQFTKTEDGRIVSEHVEGSVIGAAALIAGTTVGAGVLALPAATAGVGFLPSTFGLTSAYVYMTMSGLLIAELLLNRMATTGRPGEGIIELYKNYLGPNLTIVGIAAYFFLHYAVMVAYVAQGGANIAAILDSLGLKDMAAIHGIGQAAFACVCGLALYAVKPSVVEKANNFLVFAVTGSFLGIIGTGLPTADINSLIDPAYQHPEALLGCLPILFLSMVYQNVIPTVVTQLEGNKNKITKAIIGGTTIPYLMFLAWNAVILGNVAGADLTNVDPINVLQNSGESAVLGSLVGVFSLLAVTTSLIGFIYALLDAWTDILKLPLKGKVYDQWKPALFSLVLLPPLAFSVGNPDIFFDALDYGGAFGVSTLFLVLPPIMVWGERYGDHKPPLVTKPMVPLGKIPLGSMWKLAGTLIVEQGLEKLGVFEFINEVFAH